MTQGYKGPLGMEAEIFILVMRLNIDEMTHALYMHRIGSLYNCVAAVLPKKVKGDDVKAYQDRLDALLKEKETAIDTYDPGFEGIGTMTPEERTFIKNMGIIQGKLYAVIEDAGLIKGQFESGVDVV